MRGFRRGIRKYWGFGALAALVGGWFSANVGPAILVVLSLLVVVYFLFQAPVWCGAATREGQPCRRNSSGLLVGCGYRQHKWQRLRFVFVADHGVSRSWRKLNEGLWTSPSTGLATLSTLGGVVSAGAAVVGVFLS